MVIKSLKEVCVSISVEISSRDNMVNDISNVLLNVVEDDVEDIMLLSFDS